MHIAAGCSGGMHRCDPNFSSPHSAGAYNCHSDRLSAVFRVTILLSSCMRICCLPFICLPRVCPPSPSSPYALPSFTSSLLFLPTYCFSSLHYACNYFSLRFWAMFAYFNLHFMLFTIKSAQLNVLSYVSQ